MSRYEYQQGDSHKFWEVDVSGVELTTRWGRIGTSGQSTTKRFASEDAAQAAARKLVAEKVGKGYVEAVASAESSEGGEGPYGPLLGAADRAGALARHFRYLCDTPGYDRVLAEILARVTAVRVDAGNLVVEFGADGDPWIATPPARIGEFAEFPKSFRATVQKHATISAGKNLTLGAQGSLDFGMFGKEDQVYALFQSRENVREALHEYFANETVWVYHPEQLNSHGEPAIFPIRHELEDVIEPIDANIGALFLHRVVTKNRWPIDLPELKIATAKPGSTGTVPWYATIGWAMKKNGDRLYHEDNGPLDEWAAEAMVPEIAEMTMTDPPALSAIPLARMTALTRLVLFCSGKKPGIDTLEGVQGAVGLRRFEANDAAIKDLSPLAGLTALEILDLSGNKIRDLTPLAGCRALRILRLRYNPVTDVDVLAGLTALEEIALSDTSVRDILPLAQLPRLTSLAIPSRLPEAHLKAFKELRPKVMISR